MMGDTSANDAQPAGEQGTDYRRALPHRDADATRHLEPRKRGHQVADRRQNHRRRVHLGAAEDCGWHGLTRKPGGLVLKSSGLPFLRGSGARGHRCPLHRADNRSVAKTVACPSKPGKSVRQGIVRTAGQYEPAPDGSAKRHSKATGTAPDPCCPNPAPGRLRSRRRSAQN